MSSVVFFDHEYNRMYTYNKDGQLLEIVPQIIRGEPSKMGKIVFGIEKVKGQKKGTKIEHRADIIDMS